MLRSIWRSFIGIRYSSQVLPMIENKNTREEYEMTKWSVYESTKQHADRERSIKTTAELIWWLLFGTPKYIVTINRMKEK